MPTAVCGTTVSGTRTQPGPCAPLILSSLPRKAFVMEPGWRLGGPSLMQPLPPDTEPSKGLPGMDIHRTLEKVLKAKRIKID
jgi:hypothetical protein